MGAYYSFSSAMIVVFCVISIYSKTEILNIHFPVRLEQFVGSKSLPVLESLDW